MNNPPSVPGLPLFGNALDMSGDMRQYLTRLYREYGPVAQVRVFGQPVYVLSGVEANKFLGRGEFTYSRPVWQGLDEAFGLERSILSEDGEEHRQIRRVLRRAFSRSYLEERLDVAYSVAQAHLLELTPGTSFAVTRWCQSLLMEQLARVCTGHSARPFEEDMLRFLRISLMVALGIWPRAALLTPRYREARRSVFALAQALVTQHRRFPPEVSGRAPDLIDDLLTAQREDPRSWREADVLAGTLTAFSAGLDTAASMLSFTLYRLHRHPEVLAKVRAEVQDLWQAGPPSLEALGHAPTLHGAVLETLRLHPIAPALSRVARRPFEFGGYDIPAGARLLFGTTVPHSLPEVYPNPEAFEPERFSPPRSEHRRAGVFAPFGVGAHTCLGSGLAEGLLMLNVATMLHAASFELLPGAPFKVNYQPAPAPDTSFRLLVKGS